MSESDNYYQILGINRNASSDEIRKAYLFKANILHPDRLNELGENIRRKAEEELKKAQEVASTIDDLEVAIPVRVGENDQLFESINSQKICEKLKEMSFDIKKSQIELAEPIKEIGEFPVKIKLEHNLEVEIRVIVTKLETELP